MKMICPERDYLNPEVTNSWCCKVQIIPMRGKCRVGAERVRGRYRQIDNMKRKCQLHVTNCQVSCSNRIVVN